MARATYDGHYTPERNPNSTMLRVLANAGVDAERGPAIVDGRKPDDPDRVVRVGLECLTAPVLDEADRAGFEFLRCAGHTNGTVDATFAVEGSQ